MFIQPMQLEVVNFYKYLGVQIEARPTAMYYPAANKSLLKRLNVFKTAMELVKHKA